MRSFAKINPPENLRIYSMKNEGSDCDLKFQLTNHYVSYVCFAPSSLCMGESFQDKS